MEVKETEKVKDTEKAKKSDKKSKDEKESKEAQKIKVVAGGVKVQDHVVGKGPQAKRGDRVSMRYVGKLQNGKIFDSNTKGAPVSPQVYTVCVHV